MVIGEIPGVPLGAYFSNRRSLYASGVHRDIRRDICASPEVSKGAESVVVSPLDDDTVDLGAVLYLAGAGGRDGLGRQVTDQEMVGLNAELALNLDTREPVRVVRATTNGFRYDGLYTVENAWLSPGSGGRIACRFQLQSLLADPISGVLDAGPRVVDPAPGDAGLPPSDLPGGDSLPADRRASTQYRLVRDSAVSLAVKRLYDFCCQICLTRLETAAGLYAEGAHLVPLGGGQNGHDHISNILCLCPNDHVRLDHGAVAFTDDWHIINRSGEMLGELVLDPTHPLDVENARRHRRLMGFPG